MSTFILSTLLLINCAWGLNMLSSCGPGRKVIALTFDDGPTIENQISQKLLNKLVSHNIPATFYSSPASMGEDEKEMQGRCEMVRKLVAAGMQIGIHNWKHEKDSMTNTQLGQNIQKVAEWLKKCGVNKPTQYRPPFGILTASKADFINAMGYTIAMWNVEPNDGEKKLSGQKIFEAGFKDFQENVGIGNSAVWSLHDGMFTEGALNDFFPQIVKKFREELGYEFVTMDQCYNKCGKGQCDKVGGPKPGNGIFHPRKVKQD